MGKILGSVLSTTKKRKSHERFGYLRILPRNHGLLLSIFKDEYLVLFKEAHVCLENLILYDSLYEVKIFF
jgi:hypothetical protein